MAEKVDVEVSRLAKLLLLLLLSIFQLALSADALSVVHVVSFHHLQDKSEIDLFMFTISTFFSFFVLKFIDSRMLPNYVRYKKGNSGIISRM